MNNEVIVNNETVIIKTPYDETGRKLSFVTYADSILVDNMTLKEYLDKLKYTVDNNIGDSGDSVRFESAYTLVSQENNNYSYVSNLSESFWNPIVPSVTEELPNLWRRIKTNIINNRGIESISYDYHYCGSKGDKGIDGKSKEWIFTLDSIENRNTLQNELDSSFYNSNFQDDDFLPNNKWSDDALPIEDPKLVLWCASRVKEEGMWLKFKNLHVFNSKPLDGATPNNIYSICSTLEFPLETWESKDKEKLRSSLKFSGSSIVGFPSDTNPLWYDNIPNNVPTGSYVFLSTCYFVESDCIRIDNPIRITGDSGIGSDGGNIEFAYYTTNSNNLSEIPEINSSYTHFYGDGTWQDTAGIDPISPIKRFLFARSRVGTYNSELAWNWLHPTTKEFYGVGDNVKHYSEAPEGWHYGWGEPYLWSSWGQDGTDGDGVQYVYLRLTESEYLFIKDHPERWNFDGEPQKLDPGNVDDINSPNNPNNPINCKYVYEADPKDYYISNTQEWNVNLVTVEGVKITVKKYNLNGDLISIISNSYDITFSIDKNQFPDNTNIEPISGSMKLSFINWTGAPEFNNAYQNRNTDWGEITIHLNKKGRPSNSTVYNIICVEPSNLGDRVILTFMGNVWTFSSSNDLYDIQAPVIEGYTVYTVDTPQVLTPSNTTKSFTFRYRKNN